MTGVLQGNFDTVLWVYGLTVLCLAGYLVSVLLRIRAERRPP